MINEFIDFLRFESGFGTKVLLKDLFNINKLYRQEHYIRRLIDFSAEGGFKFTFFFSAKNMSKRKKIVDIILDGGHEIASHGYNHILLGERDYDEIINEFDLANDVFGSHGIKVVGFRPPFLSLNPMVIKVAGEYNIKYISSRLGGKKRFYDNGILEVPIINPYDWKGLIVDNLDINKLINLWAETKNGSTYLFHPWIISKYFNEIKPLLGENTDYRIKSNIEKNISVSFDVY